MEAMVSCLERFKLLHSMYFHMYIVHLYAHNTCTKYHSHPKKGSQKTDPFDFGPEILVPPQSFFTARLFDRSIPWQFLKLISLTLMQLGYTSCKGRLLTGPPLQRIVAKLCCATRQTRTRGQRRRRRRRRRKKKEE